MAKRDIGRFANAVAGAKRQHASETESTALPKVEAT
jgi:hypothetical protein